MPLSILLVDDDPAFRRLACGMLGDMELEVVGEAATVAAALAAAGDLRFDAALVDVRLPDGDGFELAQRLSGLPWRPRVVLTSSDSYAATPARAHGVGAAGFVPKAELPNGTVSTLLDGGAPLR